MRSKWVKGAGETRTICNTQQVAWYVFAESTSSQWVTLGSKQLVGCKNTKLVKASKASVQQIVWGTRIKSRDYDPLAYVTKYARADTAGHHLWWEAQWASSLLSVIPVSTMMKTRSSRKLGELESELPWMAGKAGTEYICCCSNQYAVNILPPPAMTQHTSAHPFQKLPNTSIKKTSGRWTGIWFLQAVTLALGSLWVLCSPPPGLMRSPWEFVNRHKRWSCHISLAPLFWLSSEITQCGL